MKCKRCGTEIRAGETRCIKCGMAVENAGWVSTLYRIMAFLGFFVLPLPSIMTAGYSKEVISPLVGAKIVYVPFLTAVMIVALFSFVIISFVMEIKTSNLVRIMVWGKDVRIKAAVSVILWTVFAAAAWILTFLGDPFTLPFAMPSAVMLAYHGLMFILALISGRKIRKLIGTEEEIEEKAVYETPERCPNCDCKIAKGTVTCPQCKSDIVPQKIEISGALYYAYCKLSYNRAEEEMWDKGSTGAMRWSATTALDIMFFWLIIASFALPNIVFMISGGVNRISSPLGVGVYFGSLVLAIGAYIAICLFQKKTVKAMEEKVWDKENDSAIAIAFVIWLVLAAVLTVLMMFVEASVLYSIGFLIVGSIIQLIMLRLGLKAGKAIRKYRRYVDRVK